MDLEALVARLVQVGTVSDVDKGAHRVRCLFRDTGITSGWLYVLKSPPQIPDDSLPQHTQAASGGSGESSFASHTHDLTVKPWFPKVNDQVLVVSLPVWDGDGFVLGGI